MDILTCCDVGIPSADRKVGETAWCPRHGYRAVAQANQSDEFKRGDWGTLLGRNVRVYHGSGPIAEGNLMAEGEVIGYCEVPTLVVRDSDGMNHHVAVTLPIEVQNVAWVRL